MARKAKGENATAPPPALDGATVETLLTIDGKEVRRATWKDKRRYFIDGVPYKSVTNYTGIIAKPLLVPWAAKVERQLVLSVVREVYALPTEFNAAEFVVAVEKRLGKARAADKALRKAGDIGTAVHERIEWELRKRLGLVIPDMPTLSPEGEIAFAKWSAWAKEVELRPKYVEGVLYSRSRGYAGTFDFIGWARDRYVLADWKTGSGLHKEYWLQQAAYSHALTEMGHDPVEGGLLVRLPKSADDDLEVAARNDLTPYFALFMHALHLANGLEEAE